jgi:hypothetical protein
MAVVDSNAKFLIQSETTDGDTTFTDALSLQSVSGGASTAHSTDESKFGNSSIELTGSSGNDYVAIQNSIDLDLGDSDWWMECWVNPNALVTYFPFFTTRANSGVYGGVLFRHYSGGTLQARISYSGSTWNLSISSTGGAHLVIGSWTHVALGRSGDTIYLFADGVLVGSGTIGTNSIYHSGSSWYLFAESNSYAGNGYFEEALFINGTCLHTSDFSVPTEPWSLPYFDISEVPESKQKTITLDGSIISSDQSNIPIPIVLGSSVGQNSFDVSAIFDDLGSNYKKLALHDGTNQLQIEINPDEWDVANEKAVIWTKVSSYTYATDLELTLYWDETQDDNDTYVGVIGSTPGMSVWSGQKIVFRPQDPSGSVYESVTGNELTVNGTMTADDLVDGVIGKAVALDGANDYFSHVYDSAFDIAGDQELTIFAQFQKHDSGYNNIVGFASSSPTVNYDLTLYSTTTYFQWYNSGYRNIQSSLFNALDTWYSLSFTYNNGFGQYGKDGVLATGGTVAVDLVTSTSNTLSIGRYLFGSGGYSNSTIAIVIVDANVRSEDWLLIWHNGVNDNLIWWEDVVSPDTGITGITGLTGLSVGSEGVIPLPVTLRKIIYLDYTLLAKTRNIVNLVWGLKLASIVYFQYGNALRYRTIKNLRYGDVKKLKKMILFKYGNTAKTRAIVDFVFHLMEDKRNKVDLRYHIIEEQLREIKDIKYDLSQYDKHTSLINLIYAIASDEVVEENTTLSVVNENGYILDPYHINVEKDESQITINIEIHTNVEDDYEKNPELTEVYVTINSDVYTVLVKEREISSFQINDDGEAEPDSFTLKMESPAFLLDTPYADTFSEELSGMASDIAEAMVAKVSAFTYGIEWNLLDWHIPAGTLDIESESPASVLEKLVVAAGGKRQSKKDGTLEFRKEYPVNIPDYETETPDVYFTDMDNFYSVNSITEKGDGYNNFFIGDVSPDEDDLQVESEDISAYEKLVRVFQVPWDNDTIRLATSGGTHVSVTNNGVQRMLLQEEEVEIVDGSGDTKYPVYEIKSYKYSETNLGEISEEEEGVISTDTAHNSILILSYYTKFNEYIVRDAKIETVQFWPEII